MEDALCLYSIDPLHGQKQAVRLLRIVRILYCLSKCIFVEDELGNFLFVMSQTGFMRLYQLLNLHIFNLVRWFR